MSRGKKRERLFTSHYQLKNKFMTMAKKILLIEDEKILSDLLRRRLAQEGYDVEIADNGEDGWEALKKNKPDLILLDIVMPKKDGFEILADINKDEELKRVPVIVISNSGQPLEIKRLQELGVKDWLIKTQFDPQEVIGKVKKQLG